MDRWAETMSRACSHQQGCAAHSDGGVLLIRRSVLLLSLFTSVGYFPHLSDPPQLDSNTRSAPSKPHVTKKVPTCSSTLPGRYLPGCESQLAYVLIGFLFRKTNRNYGQVLTTVKYRLNVTEQTVHACVHPPYHDPPGVSAYCRLSSPSAAERCIE